MTSKTDTPKVASQAVGQVAAQSRLGDPDEIDPGSDPENAGSGPASPALPVPPRSIPSVTTTPPTLPPSSLFETASGVILVAEVSSVQCYAEGNGKTCQVLFRSGVFVSIDFRYSLGLIEAVKAFHAWSRMLGRVS